MHHKRDAKTEQSFVRNVEGGLSVGGEAGSDDVLQEERALAHDNLVLAAVLDRRVELVVHDEGGCEPLDVGVEALDQSELSTAALLQSQLTWLARL